MVHLKTQKRLIHTSKIERVVSLYEAFINWRNIITLIFFQFCTFFFLFSQNDSVISYSQSINKKKVLQSGKYFGKVNLDIDLLMIVMGDFRLHIVNGYRFNQYLQLGAGIGVNSNLSFFVLGERFRVDSCVISKGKPYKENLMTDIPITIHVGGNVGKRKAKFFYEIEGGSRIPLNYSYKVEQVCFDYATHQATFSTTQSTFWLLGSAFGVEIFTNSRFHYSFGLNSTFCISELRQKITDIYGTKTNRFTELDNAGLGIKFGLGW